MAVDVPYKFSFAMSLLNIRVEFNFNKKEIDFELVENLRKLKDRRGS